MTGGAADVSIRLAGGRSAVVGEATMESARGGGARDGAAAPLALQACTLDAVLAGSKEKTIDEVVAKAAEQVKEEAAAEAEAEQASA